MAAYFNVFLSIAFYNSFNFEKQSALWFIAGTKHGYHTISLGLYMNEVIKRADPKGRPIWVVFDEDIAQKFGNQHYK